jgi:hypothetical protein
MDDRLLSIYLNDHLAGMSVGRSLAQRSVGNNSGHEVGGPLREILEEIEADAEVLREVMARVGARKDGLKQVAAAVAERIGRLKLNGRLVGYSPLSRVEELEGLVIGVSGKLALWRTLERLAPGDPRIAFDFAGLVRRAESQLERLEQLRVQAVEEAFRPA